MSACGGLIKPINGKAIYGKSHIWLFKDYCFKGSPIDFLGGPYRFFRVAPYRFFRVAL